MVILLSCTYNDLFSFSPFKMFSRCFSLTELQTAHKPGLLTDSFVRDLFKEHQFGETAIDTLKLLVVPHRGFCCSGKIIYIPFDDQQLLEAQKLKNIKNNGNAGLVYDAMSPYDHMNGAVITRESLDLWKGLLIHEMSHAAHHDTSYRMWLSLVQSGAGLYQSIVVPIKSFGDLAQRLGLVIAVEHVSGLTLAYYQECRADHDVIMRVKDPAILRAMYNFFYNHALFLEKHTGDDWWQILVNEHPDSRNRAENFRIAYEKLIKR